MIEMAAFLSINSDYQHTGVRSLRFGSLAQARNCFNSPLQQVTDERDRSVLHNEFGDVLMAEGQLQDARSEFAASLAIAERLAAAEPGNAEWQRDLSVSHERLGDLAEQAGDLAEAIACYRKSEPIAAALAAKSPDHPGFRNDLAITRRRIATLEAKAGG